MTRRRYVQIDGELVEVTPDYVGEVRDIAKKNALLWNDREYQDMGDPRFKSRTEHREYMKRNNLCTVDDVQGDWKKAEKRRLDWRQGIDPSRKEDLRRTIHQLKHGVKNANRS